MQGKHQLQQKQHQRVLADMHRDDRQGKLNALTIKQLDELPKGTATYRSVGKMFLSNTMDEVKEALATENAEIEERKTQHVKKKDRLAQDLKNREQEIEDVYKTLKE